MADSNVLVDISINQRKFLTKHGYIRLSEWRLFGLNSSRVLNPTTDGSSVDWFYVGSAPYTLCTKTNNPKEILW